MVGVDDMCKVEGCNNKPCVSGKGYCRKHYDQYRQFGYVTLDRTIRTANEIIVYEDYAEMLLYNDKCEVIGSTLIDIEDVDKVSQYKWRLKDNGYVSRTENKTTLYLHRFIMNYDGALDIDHINKCRTDNRKNNLRVITHSDNCINRDYTKSIQSHSKKVRCVELNKTFDSIVEATKYFNGKSKSSISNVLNGRSETAFGYHWEYINGSDAQ